MPTPLSKETPIHISHSHLPAHFSMSSMDMASDHYNIGLTISGDRKTITPTCSFTYHAGDVTLLAPYIYHRTTFQSDTPYEKVLIKYTAEFVAPFIEAVGQKVFDFLNNTKVFHFSIDHQKIIKQMFFDMLDEYQKEKPYTNFILQGMLYRLFTFILENHLPSDSAEMTYQNLTLPILTAVTYIETFYSHNPSVEEVAKYIGLSTGYFSRLFRQQLGEPYSSYLNHVKLKHASSLLLKTNKTIAQIAVESGFCHGNYFSEQFKKRYGITPKAFRNAPSSN